MDSRENLLNQINILEGRMAEQRGRIAALRADHCDPAHAIAILDAMTQGFERLMERLEHDGASSPRESVRTMKSALRQI